RDGTPTTDDGWGRRQAAALVKLLALAPGRRLHREQVIDALWPDQTLDEATPKLHKAAHFARRALGQPAGVALRDDIVSLLPDAGRRRPRRRPRPASRCPRRRPPRAPRRRRGLGLAPGSCRPAAPPRPAQGPAAAAVAAPPTEAWPVASSHVAPARPNRGALP